MAKTIDKEIFTAELNATRTILQMCILLQKYMLDIIENDNEFAGDFAEINNLVSELQTNVNNLSTALTTETSARETADTNIQNVLQEEIETRQTNDNNLQTNINNISNQYNYTGVWVSQNEYHKGDVVQYTNDVYQALTTHSGQTSSPATDTTNWEKIGLYNLGSSSFDLVMHNINCSFNLEGNEGVIFFRFYNTENSEIVKDDLTSYIGGASGSSNVCNGYFANSETQELFTITDCVLFDKYTLRLCANGGTGNNTRKYIDLPISNILIYKDDYILVN